MATVTGTKRKLSINVEALEANNTLTLGSNAVATQAWVTSTIIDGAPAALNTLNELAAALNDTSNYATTVTNALGLKLDTSSERYFKFDYDRGSAWAGNTGGQGRNRVGYFHGPAGNCYIALGSSSGDLNLSVDGNIYVQEGNQKVATEAWVLGKNYLDALPSHNHDNLYYTETEVNNLLNAKASSTHDHDDRYLRKGSGFNSNYVRAGYGYYNSVAQTYWWKVCTVVADGYYKDYNIHLDWTSRYANGEMLLHVHSDNDVILDVFDDYVMQKSQDYGKSIGDFVWVKPDQSTLEIWVATPAWQEFDYMIRSNTNEATPQITYHSMGEVEPLTATPAGATTFQYHKWNQAYDNYITGISVTGTTTKTIKLTQRDGGEISTTFTDLDTNTDTDTWRPIDDSPRDGQTTISISSNWAYDHANATNPHGITLASLGGAPSNHNHDNLYYTESEVNDLLANKANVYTNTGTVGDHDMHVWNKVHAAYSDNGGSGAYWVVETSVPQDSYSMGGFTLMYHDEYNSNTEGGEIRIYGYWNPESNSGFVGFRYECANPEHTPNIQVARNNAGNTCFIISGEGANYTQLIAKDLWLGYSANGGTASWGDGWNIVTRDDISAYVNNVSLVRSRIPAILSNGSTPYLTSGITAAEVRSLIGAGTSSFDGTWNSLSGKPTTFAPSSHTHTFASLTSKPTTISGYGITDAFDGTWASLSGKPSTFSPSSHNHDDRYYTETEVDSITHQWEWRWQRWTSLLTPAGGDETSWTNYYKTYFTERSVETDAAYPIQDRGYINTNTSVGTDGGFGGSTYGNIFGNLASYHCLIYTNIYVEREFTVNVSNFSGDDPHAIFVDGVFVHGNTGCCVDTSYSYTFKTGWHRIDLIYSEGGGGDWIRMGWNPKDYTTYISDMTPHRAGESPRKVLEKLNNLSPIATQSWTSDNYQLKGSYLTTTGKAADSNLLDGLDLHTGRNNEANKVVRTDSNGYIQAGWINTTSGATTSALSRIYASNDGYVRYVTPAEFRRQITDGVYQPAGNYLTSEQIYTQLATKADASHSHDLIVERPNIQYGTGFLQWTDLSGTGGTGLSGSQPQNPFNDWHHHIIMNHANGSGYYVDLAFSFHNDRIHFRRKAGTDPMPWRELIHSGNIGTQTVASAGVALSMQWNNILSKPSSFTPSAHTHNTDEIVGLQAELDLKAGKNGGYDDNFYVNALYYDDWVRNHSNNNGMYWSATGWHLYPQDNDDFLFRSGNSSSSAIRFNTNGVSRNYLYNNSSNEIGFLNTSRSWIFKVTNSGTVTASGDVIAFSDERLKENIETIPNALEKVEAMRGVTFTRKDTGKESIGLIAQEVEEVIPEAVNNEGEYKGVAYGNLVGVLIEAVKELSAEVKELKAKLGE